MATSWWRGVAERSPSCCHQEAQRAPSHLEQPSVVGVVILVSALLLHLVPLAGPDQLLGVVEQSRVQRVGVDQTHQVFFVVLPAGTHDVLVNMMPLLLVKDGLDLYMLGKTLTFLFWILGESTSRSRSS